VTDVACMCTYGSRSVQREYIEHASGGHSFSRLIFISTWNSACAI
jgi:hypothetical protein